jgi:hypothetical protein
MEQALLKEKGKFLYKYWVVVGYMKSLKKAKGITNLLD